MPGAFSNLHGNPAAIPTRTRFNLTRSSLGCRPSAVSVAQNQSYWASIEAQIEAHLNNALPARHPVSVFEPLRHLALAAPRTAAPALCIAACELVGGDRNLAADAASAIHLIHAATHTHRHLPLSDVPGPKPDPIPHKFGPNIELLTGDALVPLALELLARSVENQARNDPVKIVRVIVEFARAAGSQGVLHARGGGELHACGSACGAIIGGGSEEEIEKLRKYGFYVAMINGTGKNEKGMEKKMKEWKVLAMKELDIFKGKEIIGQIVSKLEPAFCSV